MLPITANGASSYSYEPGGSLEDELIAAGYVWYPIDDIDLGTELQAGDIMVRPMINGNTGHVEIFDSYGSSDLDYNFSVYTWGHVYSSEPVQYVGSSTTVERYSNYSGFWRCEG